MREKYPEIFPENEEFNYNTLYASASAMNRTLMSSNAFFVGLYGFGHLNQKIEVDDKYT